MHKIEVVQCAIDYIEEQLTEELSLEEISKAAAVSLPNLYRLFYALTGHPIKEYIRKRRTHEAANLLRQTNMPSTEIGFRCGFDTYQTFIKTFKRNTGLTPGLYRKAEVIYHFERISLLERETYLEEREISERYPDVKVIRLAPLSGVGYLHTSEREEGIEERAYIRFQAMLTECGFDISKVRLFGWNVDGPGEQVFGYQMFFPSHERMETDHPELRAMTLPGGTYAATWISNDSGPKIVNAWNRLLSEWLPRSIFELGDHGFLEEYQHYNGKIARLKLHLPVRRSQQKGSIEIVERDQMKVMLFRSEGVGCEIKADEAAAQWIRRNGFNANHELYVFMSFNYGKFPDESKTYELKISLPEGYVPSREEAHIVASIEGGLYACLKTKAFGFMTGILERMYRWLVMSDEYTADEERSWYAQYVPDERMDSWSEEGFERSVSVKCFVPVRLRHNQQEV